MKEYEKLAKESYNPIALKESHFWNRIDKLQKEYDRGLCDGLERGFVKGFLKAREMAVNHSKARFTVVGHISELETLGEKEAG